MLSSAVSKQLAGYRAADLIRRRIMLKKSHDNNVVEIDDNACINFCSNDYLCLSQHPAVKLAFIAGIEKYGIGSGASALVSGYYKAQQLFEEKFAAFMQRDRAIFFNSGYHANLGVMTTFADKNSIILSDKECHASILDGIKLSGAKHQRFRHQDIIHLEHLLQQHAGSVFVVAESVYSMSGDIAPLNKMVTLTQQYQANLMLDDAHGFAVLGKTGQGASEHFNLNQTQLPCIITPLGKACGSMGAMVSGAHDVIEALLQLARTYRYTTALPPAIALANSKAIEIIETERWRREKLANLSNFFIQAAKERDLKLLNEEAIPIKSLVIGDNKLTLHIQQQLIQHGFYVSCIRPPTVPLQSARIRISLNCNHDENEIIQLLDYLANYVKHS